jgi:hypothetical protein
MPVDRSFVEMNRAATQRIRALAARMSDPQFREPIGRDWTVAVVFAHLAFWDARVQYALEATEKSGQVVDPVIDLAVNDFSTTLWAAIAPREAARIAVETAESLDLRLERCPAALIEEIHRRNPRMVFRALHRNEHLDEVEAALKR